MLDDVRLARRLRASRFDVVLDLHGGPRSAWLAFATGAGQRIGYDIPGRTWMYTRTVHRPRELRPRHSVSNQWDLLQAIEGWPGGAADPDANPVEMPLDSAVDARIGEALRAAGVQPSDELIVVHVSAGNPFRRWPEPAFTRLVAALAANGDRRRLILSSGPSDRGAAQRITAAARAELGSGRALRASSSSEISAWRNCDRSWNGAGCSSAATRARCTSPRRRAHRSSESTGRRCRHARRRGAPRSLATEAVETEGLPCRPCDQRVCEPGDFRCLTLIAPEDVVSAAERVLRQSQ